MKRFATFLCLAGVVGGAGMTACGPAAPRKPSMSISVLAPKSAITVTSTRPVSMTVKVTGLKLDLNYSGSQSVPGTGHIQIYLDHIPSAAYKTGGSQNLVVVVGSRSFSFQVNRRWTRMHRGRHKFILALAKNNNVLYRAPTDSIAVTVK